LVESRTQLINTVRAISKSFGERLDFLSVRNNVLFLVSGGNVATPLDIPDYANWTAFETDSGAARERAVPRFRLKAMASRVIQWLDESRKGGLGGTAAIMVCPLPPCTTKL
jgi:hypothetical protein